ncbi:MAG: EpsI family protein [Gammaproteobacteria bacterium]|nr:EpsI family protein [Gammaproteobacteria bacterium]
MDEHLERMRMRTLLLDPKTLLPIALLIAGAVIGMSSILAWVVTAWWSFFGVGVYSHGYLVLGLALWIGWTQWQRDPPSHLGPWWWGLIPLAVLITGMATMELIYINTSRALLLPLLFVAATSLVFGLGAARRVLMPAGFVYFGLLPFWMLDPLLQALATRAVSILMNFGDVPFFIEGFYIHIPAGTFEIASACSGLSFLMSAVTLATFYSAMYLRRWPYRVTLVVAAAAAALVSNWIRVWTLILIGEHTALEHWLIDDHYFYGWVLFIIALVPILFLARQLEIRELEQAKSSDPASPSAVARPEMANLGPLMLAALAGALLLTLPSLLATEPASVADQPPLDLPDLAHVGAEPAGDPAWQPDFRDARQGHGAYVFAGGTVEVFVAFYAKQDADHHLFLPRNNLLGDRRRRAPDARRTLTLEGDTFEVNEFIDTTGRSEQLIWGWYEVAGRIVNTRLGAKIAEVAAMPSGRNDGMVIAVATDCDTGCDQARERLEAFLQAAGSELRKVP